VARLLDWIMRSREPDVVIGGYEKPYVLRWYLIPRNDWLSIYLHLFIRGDEDDALHDHMGDSASIIFESGYFEEFRERIIARKPGRIYFRWAETPHRIYLHPGQTAVTIFVTARRRREWGFHCPYGWMHWKKIIGTGHYGSRPGCAAFDPGAGAADKSSLAREPQGGQTKSPP
jgi:hypothetical protein